ncbi:GTP-binding protein [Agromyces sp. MMS24-K17]|uniref:GTP-binding protein n=1 Tax=Agromyces sp. MMS24-K17 TaxID=3372850 RepID=UPI003754BC30
MRTLNLGIVAHVDAGKTSLTERLLAEAGVLDQPGSVDAGTTVTDSLDLERRRGITIRSSVVSFDVPGRSRDADAPDRHGARIGADDAHPLTVNLIDTPGHSDFIAEVERALAVLDGAVLVVSAVEGVQAQTVVLMRTLQRLGLPVILFVNKVDRAGADPARVVADLRRRLTERVAMCSTVTAAGTPEASVADASPDDLIDLVAGCDDRVLEAWVDGTPPPESDLHRRFGELSRAGVVHAVLAGSARTGAGIRELLDRLGDLLPGLERDESADLAASVFKIERDDRGERQVFVHVGAGTLRVRDRVDVGGAARVKATGIRVFEHGSLVEAEAAPAGRIALVRGFDDARIGDAVGRRDREATGAGLPRPMLQAVVDVPDGRAGAVFAALTELAEQDPFIDLRQDDARGEITVMVSGEVQKEVLQTMLGERYGLDVGFQESTVVCVERLVGTGEAVEFLKTPTNPFIATVGLRLEPAPPGTGVVFGLGVEPGAMPPAFFAATEASVRLTLEQGLSGWLVPDCIVTMTHSGYWPRQSKPHQRFSKASSSTGADFRAITPLVLVDALRRAGTVVCEPMHRFELEVPRDLLGSVLGAITRLEAVPTTTEERRYAAVVTGRVPLRRLDEIRAALPGLTRGEGALRSEPDGDQPVHGDRPARARLGNDPLDREEYLRRLARTVNGV